MISIAVGGGAGRGGEEQCREQGQEDGPSHRRIHASSPFGAPASARDMPVGPGVVACTRRPPSRAGAPSRRAQRGVGVQAVAARRAARRRRPRGRRARCARAHESAGGGSDGVCGDHGNSLVEGFVDDEPPRLEKVARGNRRYDHNVAARVEVAQIGGRGSERDRARRTSGPSPASTSVPSPARRVGEHVDALLALGPAGEQDLEVAVALGGRRARSRRRRRRSAAPRRPGRAGAWCARRR